MNIILPALAANKVSCKGQGGKLGEHACSPGGFLPAPAHGQRTACVSYGDVGFMKRELAETLVDAGKDGAKRC